MSSNVDVVDTEDYDVGLNVSSDDEYEAIIASVLWPNHVEKWFVLILSMMMVIGIIGNVLVVLAVATNRSMRNPLNLVLMNLAVADLLILLFCLPLTVINDVTKTFWFSTVFCKLVLFIQNTSVYVSIMSLVFITCERWRAITFPLKPPLLRTRRIIPALWLVAMLFSTPEPFTLQLLPAVFARPNFTTTWGTQCKETWSHNFQRHYQLAQALFSYLLPLLVISILCVHMMFTLHTSSTKLCITNRQLRSRKKAVRMLGTVVFMFAMSNLPVHLYNIALSFNLLEAQTSDEIDENLIAIRKLLPRVFSYSSSCLNPIVYSFLSGRFREEFGRVVCCVMHNEKRSREFRRRQASVNAFSQRTRTNSFGTSVSVKFHETSMMIMASSSPVTKRRPTAQY